MSAERLVSEHAARNVGTRISWTQEKPRYKHVDGVCVAVERVPGATLTNDRGTFPAIRFGIRDDAGKLHWTTLFADDFGETAT